jgi:hypothetical protein
MTAPSFRRRPDVLWRRSLDALVLLPPSAEEVMTVGGTGADVWELLETWRTVDGLAQSLSQHYEADEAIVHRDLEVLVAQLVEQGALEVAAESGEPGGSMTNPDP